ncbi:flagellar hook-length control protein FliK [Halanaerobacter jeridensis]|uniref:Flagellar hook-length control protein-like C-terminal domain-containing protein n=1 Tax=Halanaerobacter jeridensis TaxID=706427 RepID=A0A938XUK3_9FIRM|nr:flagellar hook-length control protein FliK [Halanaerobacter jeridensis]MBM7555525.1 hypothetical protein [Halanaerobacter jeridensis]
MNNKINLPVTLKQYNLDTNKMSTSIPKKEVKNLSKNLSITALLQNLSLSATKTNQTIVSELLNHDLALNKQLISELNDFVSNLATNDNLETKVKVALLLKKINIPLNKKFYNFFKNYIFSKTDLQKNIKELMQQLNLSQNNSSVDQNKTTLEQQSNSLNSQQSIETNQSQNNTLKSLLDINFSKNDLNLSQTKLNTILKQLDLAPTKENRAIIKKLIDYKLNINKDNWQKLKSASENNQSLSKVAFTEKLNINQPHLLNQINFQSDSKLDSSLLKLSKVIINQNFDSSQLNQLTAKIKDLVTKEPQLLLKLKENFSAPEFKNLSNQLNLSKVEQNNALQQGLKDEILNTIITANDLEPSTIQQSINKLNSGQDNQLVKFLFQLSQETSSEQLQEKTEDLTKQLLNLKAVNYEAENTLLFLPILFQEGLELAQIKFDQQEKEQTSKEQSFKFAFKVNTEKLGSLEVKVKIKDKQLNILFLVENPDSKELLTDNLASLKTAFQTHEYNLNYLQCKLQNNKNNNEEKETSLTTIDYTI